MADIAHAAAECREPHPAAAPHVRATEGPSGESGFSVVELVVAMAGMALVSLMMLSVFTGATEVDELHAADDAALEQLRDARERMSRDVRQARRFTAVAGNGFTVWIDEGWDEVIGPGELVSWWFDSTGRLQRRSGDVTRLEARDVAFDLSYFSFDSVEPTDVTAMAMHLVVVVDSRTGTTRALDTEITLRNMP